MSRYDDYLEAVEALVGTIVKADHAAAESQRSTSSGVEACEQALRARLEAVQRSAATAAHEYASSARLLQQRTLEGLGVQLPERVRPALATALLPQAALDEQRSTSRRLALEIERFKEAVAAESAASDDLAAALAARRAALAQKVPRADPIPHEEPAPAESRYLSSGFVLIACLLLVAALAALGWTLLGVWGITVGGLVVVPAVWLRMQRASHRVSPPSRTSHER